MEIVVFIFTAFVLYSAVPASSLPAQHTAVQGASSSEAPFLRSLWKRFIDSSSRFGEPNHNGLGKIRTRRSSEEQCEQRELCRLHARSASNFVAAFELYFVNRENARLWDHRARSPADCDRRFSCDR